MTDDFVGLCFYCGWDVLEGEEVIEYFKGVPVIYHHACYDDEIVLGV